MTSSSPPTSARNNTARDFPARAVYRVPSATFTSRAPLAMAKTFGRLVKGFFQARHLLEMVQPHVVIGFGGYPTLPPIMAARSLGIPTVIHEQNAVMGRANRLLSRFADASRCRSRRPSICTAAPRSGRK